MHSYGPGRRRKRRLYDDTPSVGAVEFANYDAVNIDVSQTYQTPTVTVASTPWPDPDDGSLQARDLTGTYTVTYETSNGAVATISGSGLVTGIGSGSCTVRALCEGVRSPTISVTVTNPQNSVDHLVVTPATMSLAISGTGQVAARPEDTSNNLVTGRTVTHASDDTGIATVGADSGNDNHTATVTAVTAGTATITSTCDTKTDTCVVTVSSGTLYWADKLDSGNFNKTMGSARWLTPTNATIEASSGPFAGDDFVVLCPYGPGQSNCELYYAIGANVTDLYWGMYFKYPSTYVHQGAVYNKFLRFWGGANVTGGGKYGYTDYHVKCGFSTAPRSSAPFTTSSFRPEYGIKYTASGGTPAGTHSGVGNNPDLNNFQSGTQGANLGGTGQVLGVDPPFPLNQWVKATGRVRVASGYLVTDGILTLKFGSTTVQNHTNMPLYSPFASAKNYCHHGYVLGAANSGFASSTPIRWTRFRVASTEALADPDNTTGW